MKLDRKLLLAAALATAAPAGLLSHAAVAQDVEEIIVTGSHIRGTAENAELPVDVMRRSDLEDLGSPTLIEMVRNIGAASANLGETNQFQANGLEGSASINLRGLGASRSLILLNGRRHVATNYNGVDISFLPKSAIGRIEVLKDGAAALYGSDAIGGTVNFITRSNFEGLELSATHQIIAESNGDTEIGGIFGWSGDRTHWIVAADYKHRSRLMIRDIDWAMQDYASNPEGGWSSVGNPGTLFGNPLLPFGIDDVIAPDPQCDLLGGSVEGPLCKFQYTYYDNLVENEDHYNIYTELNRQISDNTNFYVEASYSKVELPDWNTSPAYPPQALTGADRYVWPSHPGLQALFADNPAWAATYFPGGLQSVITFSRMTGVAGLNGKAEEGSRNTDTYRFVTGLEGSTDDGAIDYNFSLSWSKRNRRNEGNDMYVERMATALDGYGGANCDLTGAPGVGDCFYYNPFSNAIAFSPVTGETNPQFDPALANSPEMFDWLTDTLGTDYSNELLVMDAVISGMTGWQFGGGEAGYALGAQVRRDKFSSTPDAINNLTKNPCPFNDPFSLTLGNTSSLDCTGTETGLFAFLAGSDPESDERTVWGVFGELAVPVTEKLNMQLALRYEDYGGETGTTTDPKVAFHYQVNDSLAFRGSASSTFRGPSLASLSGRTTTLAYVAKTTAFKAVDTFGDARLRPEKAVTTNFGALFNRGNFNASVDYWKFDFEDPIQVESFNQIVDAYVAQGCEDGGAGAIAGTDSCTALRGHIFPLGITASKLERIDRSFLNGGSIETSGLDFQAQLDFELTNANLAVGFEGTKVIEYVSQDFVDVNDVVLAPGVDAVGQLNESNPFGPMPELKGNIFVKYDRGQHNVRYAMRYISDYKDETKVGTSFHTVDSMITHDIHYNYRWTDDTKFSFSIFNALDEEPPLASNDLGYDAWTHNAFGRMFKIGVTHVFK